MPGRRIELGPIFVSSWRDGTEPLRWLANYALRAAPVALAFPAGTRARGGRRDESWVVAGTCSAGAKFKGCRCTSNHQRVTNQGGNGHPGTGETGCGFQKLGEPGLPQVYDDLPVTNAVGPRIGNGDGRTVAEFPI